MDPLSDDTFIDQKREGPSRSQRPLNLDFSSMSDFVIPKGPLCGRLVACYATPQHRPRNRGIPESVKVLGFPTMIEKAGRYQRNHFIFNLCFVFDERADTIAYEPIVRKCARVLRSLEEENWFLSRIDNLPKLYGIVEQLYEDLNAYYETFIALPEELSPSASHDLPSPGTTLLDVEDLDEYIARASGPAWRENQVATKSTQLVVPNEQETFRRKEGDGVLADDERDSDSVPVRRTRSQPSHSPGSSIHDISASDLPLTRNNLGRIVRDAINLKLFPNFPNPPQVRDWDVPVLTVDLASHITGSWDLTLVRLIPFIDGVSHTRRIAKLADADLELTRQCIQHLLYYSFAVVIDIFQYSNMYALRPQMAVMCDDVKMGLECAEYVSVPGHPVPAIPTLMRMYSMLRQGRLVSDWIEELGQIAHGVDARRLITFGIIKGFLRRIHRYPILVPADADTTSEAEHEWPKGPKNAPLSASVALRSDSMAARDATDAWNRAAGDYEDPQAEQSRNDRFARSMRRPGRGASSSLQRKGRSPSEAPTPRTESFQVPAELPGMLDGQHCDDELMSDRVSVVPTPWRVRLHELYVAHPTVVTACPASLISTIASFPFDTIKSRLQVKYYPSAWSCARSIVREEGFGSLFRGVTIPLITITFVRTLSFSIYSATKNLLERCYGSNDGQPLWRTSLYGFAGGMTSGAIISSGSAPFELVKVQRQLEYLIATQRAKNEGDASRPFKRQSGFEAARDIYRTHGGVRGFYLGFKLHMIRDMLGTALYFGIYDSVRRLGDQYEAESQYQKIPSPVLSFALGSASGMLSWLLIYPVDLIKTRIQQDALAGNTAQSAARIFNQLMADDPARPEPYRFKRFLRLYRGLGISAIRSFFTHGMNWMIIETIARYMREPPPDANPRLLDYTDFQ
ncbi:hypothetical protein MCUN1_002891 [Malassezia cuniculi]|uniref:Mitochondrial carrier n=1 Tax=Malassezia cuniculi TaxID=948313 RepID=A0AAF0EVW2_9BASI|nr:hypothetical protein MCUN1_002891 [Malassezia cuniculi]